jgi:hypothetical protein
MRTCREVGGTSDRRPERRSQQFHIEYEQTVFLSEEELRVKYARTHRLLFSLPDGKSPKPTGE